MSNRGKAIYWTARGRKMSSGQCSSVSVIGHSLISSPLPLILIQHEAHLLWLFDIAMGDRPRNCRDTCRGRKPKQIAYLFAREVRQGSSHSRQVSFSPQPSPLVSRRNSAMQWVLVYSIHQSTYSQAPTHPEHRKTWPPSCQRPRLQLQNLATTSTSGIWKDRESFSETPFFKLSRVHRWI